MGNPSNKWKEAFSMRESACVCVCVCDFVGVGMMGPRKRGTADTADGNVFIWLRGIPQRSEAKMQAE